MRGIFVLILLASTALIPGRAQPTSPQVSHDTWDKLVKEYVREDHRVDYARWKSDGTATLDGYIASLARPFPAGITKAERNAALTNAYNALTVRWMLGHFPTKSIWKTKQPFTGKRHTVDGKTVSLDDIETGLRETMGERTHAVLVCAARSCPPLRREAFVANRLDTQLDDNTREWLANDKLNQFFPEKNRADVSSIFKWYKGDFEKNGATLEGFLAKYAPSDRGAFLTSGKKPDIDFKGYDWGLNDTGDAGKGYRGFYFDYLRNK